uniref:Uncharacterized protein n=1 Tax=Oryzias sinensis TaxID=183150 RepID=A0A8C7X5F8_9TELE
MAAKGEEPLLLWACSFLLIDRSLSNSALTLLLSDHLQKWFEMKPIPGLEKTYPIIGNSLYFKANAGEFFNQILEFCDTFRDEPLFKIWVGPVPFVVLFHSETVEKVLSNPVHLDKSFAYTFLHPWLGTGLLTSTGKKWKQRRRILTPTFHFSILTDFLEVMNEQAELLVEKLDKLAGKGQFNCFSHVTLCALDIICGKQEQPVQVISLLNGTQSLLHTCTSSSNSETPECPEKNPRVVPCWDLNQGILAVMS